MSLLTEETCTLLSLGEMGYRASAMQTPKTLVQMQKHQEIVLRVLNRQRKNFISA
ncbi:hypothetical protein DPMN_123270 [Dreissena polymorpha]|uniref:Uncharacterized protein n=1 Tax=Dreissena polymorpha TaxID=45954 RepID=A0A9D4GQ14_DREPO|nr:hypothetical protein DPMN_123270 [Dreissena polymorpha]